MHRVAGGEPRGQTEPVRCLTCRAVVIFCAVLSLVCGPAAAQNPWSAADSNQAAVSIDALWEMPGSVASAGVAAAFSIGGVLEVGVGMELKSDEVNDQDAREVGGRITLAVFPLRQGPGVPISLLLRGSYGLSRTHSDYLEDNGKSMRGQGFTAGLTLMREFRLQRTSFRLGATSDYRSYVYTTDTESPPASTTSREGTLTYGAFVGLGVLLSNGALLTTDVVATSGSEGVIQAGPVVRFAFPTAGN